MKQPGPVNGHHVVILSGVSVSLVIALTAAVSIAFGIALLVPALNVHVLRVRYDNRGPVAGGLADANARQAAMFQQQGLQHQISFRITERLEPPVYMYYQLNGFHQNHKRYVRSVSWKQMAGYAGVYESLPTCKPRRYVSDFTTEQQQLPDRGSIDPCGLLPGSLFNDTLTEVTLCCNGDVTPVAPPLSCPANQQQTVQLEVSPFPSGQSGLANDLFGNKKNATNFNTIPATRLGGTIDGPISESAALRVWANPGAAPTVTKPWAVIHSPIPAGCWLNVSIDGQYNTYAWGGHKNVVVATSMWAGSSRNLFLPILLIATGGSLGLASFICIAVGLFNRRTELVCHVAKPVGSTD